MKPQIKTGFNMEVDPKLVELSEWNRVVSAPLFKKTVIHAMDKRIHVLEKELNVLDTKSYCMDVSLNVNDLRHRIQELRRLKDTFYRKVRKYHEGIKGETQ